MLLFVDYDDFIVDDEGQPISKMKKKKLVHNDVYVSQVDFTVSSCLMLSRKVAVAVLIRFRFVLCTKF